MAAIFPIALLAGATLLLGSKRARVKRGVVVPARINWQGDGAVTRLEIGQQYWLTVDAAPNETKEHVRSNPPDLLALDVSIHPHQAGYYYKIDITPRRIGSGSLDVTGQGSMLIEVTGG